jgi:nucleotide-binding universal stress UspA family protein
VLLIRSPADKAALQQRSLVKRILVPLDGSKLSEVAIPYAEALAQVLGAELFLFQTFTPPTLEGTYRYSSIPATTLKEAEEHTRKSAMDYLDSLGKAFQEKGITTLSVVKSGAAADQILEYAEANEINLIAMSTHGRSGIGRWVLGSVTDKVLHAGDTAVLTVRATKV